MAEVSIMVGGRRYQMACEDGQEDRLRALARRIDEEAQALAGSGQVSEPRLLLMAALMLADKLDETEQALETAEAAPAPAPAPAAPPVIDQDLFAVSRAEAAETEAAIADIVAAARKIEEIGTRVGPTFQPDPPPSAGPGDKADDDDEADDFDDEEGVDEDADKDENPVALSPRARRAMRRAQRRQPG